MLCATALVLVVPMALAQQEAPAPAPTPVPSRIPSVITLPGVVPERYSLPGGTPVPVPSAPPVVTPAPLATPSAAASRAPAPRVEPRPASAPPRPAPAASPTGVTTTAPSLIPAPPVAVATSPSPSPVALPANPPAAMPGWLWMLIGAGTTALAGAVAWALLRRRPALPEEEEEALPVVARAPLAAPPPPHPVSAARPQSDPFELQIRPIRIELGERAVALEFELLVGNLQPVPAEGVRVSLGLISASPDQDRMVEAFHRGPPGEAAGDPFDLGPGSGARMPARLMLPREHVHIVRLGTRPMFVAMVMVDLRWRAGLSIRRFGGDFMIGAGGQGGKIGPIWLDRGQPAGPLGATRYTAHEVAAA